MDSTRQNKIARLIQKELSDIFLHQTKSMRGVIVSVSEVRISPDLSIAKAYLSVFPSEKGEEIRHSRFLHYCCCHYSNTRYTDPVPAGFALYRAL